MSHPYSTTETLFPAFPPISLIGHKQKTAPFVTDKVVRSKGGKERVVHKAQLDSRCLIPSLVKLWVLIHTQNKIERSTVFTSAHRNSNLEYHSINMDKILQNPMNFVTCFSAKNIACPPQISS